MSNENKKRRIEEETDRMDRVIDRQSRCSTLLDFATLTSSRVSQGGCDQYTSAETSHFKHLNFKMYNKSEPAFDFASSIGRSGPSIESRSMFGLYSTSPKRSASVSSVSSALDAGPASSSCLTTNSFNNTLPTVTDVSKAFRNPSELQGRNTDTLHTAKSDRCHKRSTNRLFDSLEGRKSLYADIQNNIYGGRRRFVKTSIMYGGKNASTKLQDAELFSNPLRIVKPLPSAKISKPNSTVLEMMNKDSHRITASKYTPGTGPYRRLSEADLYEERMLRLQTVRTTYGRPLICKQKDMNSQQPRSSSSILKSNKLLNQVSGEDSYVQPFRCNDSRQTDAQPCKANEATNIGNLKVEETSSLKNSSCMESLQSKSLPLESLKLPASSSNQSGKKINFVGKSSVVERDGYKRDFCSKTRHVPGDDITVDFIRNNVGNTSANACGGTSASHSVSPNCYPSCTVNPNLNPNKDPTGTSKANPSNGPRSNPADNPSYNHPFSHTGFFKRRLNVDLKSDIIYTKPFVFQLALWETMSTDRFNITQYDADVSNKKSNMWECLVCMFINEPKKTQCSACHTYKSN